jgi:uncharacterized protein (TIGR02246 family)
MDQLTATRHAERIREREDFWCLAVARRDVDAMMEMYAPDAHELVAGQPAMTGHEAIRDFYRGVLDEFPRLRQSFDLQEITIAESADLAVVRGTYRFTPNADVPGDVEIGKFVGVWIFFQGDWRLQVNIANSDDPA